jgi:hypothetical protein
VLKSALRDMYGAPRPAAAARMRAGAFPPSRTLRTATGVTEQRLVTLAAALSSVCNGVRVEALHSGCGGPGLAASVALVCSGPCAAAEVRQWMEAC